LLLGTVGILQALPELALGAGGVVDDERLLILVWVVSAMGLTAFGLLVSDGLDTPSTSARDEPSRGRVCEPYGVGGLPLTQ
jgi:hypothetical protein